MCSMSYKKRTKWKQSLGEIPHTVSTNMTEKDFPIKIAFAYSVIEENVKIA